MLNSWYLLTQLFCIAPKKMENKQGGIFRKEICWLAYCRAPSSINLRNIWNKKCNLNIFIESDLIIEHEVMKIG